MKLRLSDNATVSQKIRYKILIAIGLLLIASTIYVGTPALVNALASKITNAYTQGF